MSARVGVLAVWIVGVLSPPAVTAAVTAWTDVTVRVYDGTQMPPSDRRAALKVASTILSAADVEVTWRECEAGASGAGHACDAPMARGELAIRIVRSPARTADDRVQALGDALVDTQTGQAVLATLYVDRVQRLADAAGTDARTLLGRTLAHELGHLLVATSAHSTHGLMRAVWSRDEVQHGGDRDWTFTKPDIAAIRRRARLNLIPVEAWGTK